LLVSKEEEEPAIESVVKATGATIAATVAANGIFRNMTRFQFRYPPWPGDAASSLLSEDKLAPA
jgi:hypothetical protein